MGGCGLTAAGGRETRPYTTVAAPMLCDAV